MRNTQAANTVGAIWHRVLQPMGKSLSVTAARALLKLEFSAEDHERMNDLAAKARDGSLTAAEQVEIREYERAGNLLGLIKSLARQRLKTDSRSNGSAR